MIKDDWFMETMRGFKIYPSNPEKSASQISILDISTALSHTNRFGGHSIKPYSVAKHCIAGAMHIVQTYRDVEAALAFLFHDAAEAYLGDIPTPLKRCVPDFEDLELKWIDVIFSRFEISHEHWDIVHEVDKLMLYSEANLLQPNNSWVDKSIENEHVTKMFNTDLSCESIAILYNNMYLSLIEERRNVNV